MKKKRHFDQKFHQSIKEADEVLRRFKVKRGVPGLSVGVSVDGRIVWKTGYGYADLENLQPCTGDSAMRIASISKSITMTLVAKLMQENRLDLDAPIQKYVPIFPEKEIDGEKVIITTRHLVSHMSGIRHYDKDAIPPKTTNIKTTGGISDQEKVGKLQLEKKDEEKTASGNISSSDTTKLSSLCEKCQQLTKEPGQQKKKSEFENEEYYSQKQYNSVSEALSMFKDDPLLWKPGSKFLYTTHGWTLVSAVLEGASGEKFPVLLEKLFAIFGMHQTYLDENYPLIPNRAKYYRRSLLKGYHLENVPSVNNSYKWAGGGVVSTVGDLLSFANTMLYFYRHCPDETTRTRKCYLNRKTLDRIWTPVAPDGAYAMGWVISPNPELANVNGEFYVWHTGGAIGASSVLLLKPTTKGDKKKNDVAVVVLTNLEACDGLKKLAFALAEIFDRDGTVEDI